MLNFGLLDFFYKAFDEITRLINRQIKAFAMYISKFELKQKFTDQCHNQRGGVIAKNDTFQKLFIL